MIHKLTKSYDPTCYKQKRRWQIELNMAVRDRKQRAKTKLKQIM